jgi:hypothetical protein
VATRKETGSVQSSPPPPPPSSSRSCSYSPSSATLCHCRMSVTGTSNSCSAARATTCERVYSRAFYGLRLGSEGRRSSSVQRYCRKPRTFLTGQLNDSQPFPNETLNSSPLARLSPPLCLAAATAATTATTTPLQPVVPPPLTRALAPHSFHARSTLAPRLLRACSALPTLPSLFS